MSLSVFPASPRAQSFRSSSSVQGASASLYFGPILPMVCLRWLRDRCLRLPLNTDVSAMSCQLNSSAAFRQSAISSNSEYWGFPPPRPSSSCSSFCRGGALKGLAVDSRKSESRRARQILRCDKYKRSLPLLTAIDLRHHCIPFDLQGCNS